MLSDWALGVCCFTPVLLGLVGLASLRAYVDYCVLLPLMIIFCFLESTDGFGADGSLDVTDFVARNISLRSVAGRRRRSQIRSLCELAIASRFLYGGPKPPSLFAEPHLKEGRGSGIGHKNEVPACKIVWDICFVPSLSSFCRLGCSGKVFTRRPRFWLYRR